jgi:hypothetical protein
LHGHLIFDISHPLPFFNQDFRDPFVFRTDFRIISSNSGPITAGFVQAADSVSIASNAIQSIPRVLTVSHNSLPPGDRSACWTPLLLFLIDRAGIQKLESQTLPIVATTY